MRSTLRMAFLSILATAASTIAVAQDAASDPQAQVAVKGEVVRYDDLRLISAVGAAVLYGRIRSAAEKACGVPPDNRQIAMDVKYRACVDDAISNAVVQVNAPVLSTYYASKRSAPAQSRTTSPTVTAAAEGR